MHTMWVSYVINGSHTLISDQQQSSLLCTFSVSAESHRLWSLHHFSELQASRGAAVGQYAAAVMRNVPVMLSHFPGCLLTSYVTESHPTPLISCWDSQQGMMGEILTQCSLFPLLSFPISVFVSQFVLQSVCLSVVCLLLIVLFAYKHNLYIIISKTGLDSILRLHRCVWRLGQMVDSKIMCIKYTH